MKRIGSWVVVAVLFACTVYANNNVPFNPQAERSRKLVVAQTTQGPVAGFQNRSGLDVFLGIPYAKPPVGKLRFAPPQPTDPWTFVRPAYLFSPTCPQPIDKFEPSSLLHQDEDCLSLNIWTPGIGDKKRPVAVWIHGGGFIHGGTGDPLYNGEHLAKRGDIVVATINYRVGSLGFLYLDDFGPEFAGSGNLALQDQIAALTWIKNNISKFGGDPSNVTIMGESAGSASVMFLMVSPKSKGLFQKAIAESGALCLARNKAMAQQWARRFMAIAGVKDVAGLRALPVRKMIDLEIKLLGEAGFEAELVFAPVLDDVVNPSDPMKALAGGTANGISLLNGTTLDEYRYWGLFIPVLKTLPPKTVLSSAPALAAKLGKKQEAILNSYRKTLPNPGASDVTFALVTDAIFRIPHLRVSDIQSKHAPVYMYRFDWKSSAVKDLGACHAIEVPFVFRTFDSPTADQLVGRNFPLNLSDAMMDAWIGFIRSGNPNSAGLPHWPTYDTKRRATMIFNTQSVVRDDPDKNTRQLYKGMLGDTEFF